MLCIHESKVGLTSVEVGVHDKEWINLGKIYKVLKSNIYIPLDEYRNNHTNVLESKSSKKIDTTLKVSHL